MILAILGLAVAGLAGAISHEIAHWVVWRVVGRRPKLLLWELEVQPRDGPVQTTVGDRVAATAPYALGAAAIWTSVTLSYWPGVIFGAFAIGIPSMADIQTMLGRSEWAIESRQASRR